MARILLNVPKQARRGEAVEIKLLINHPMETGQRRDETGQIVPRNIIKDVVCTYGGAEVVRLELFPAISANPFLHFAARAETSGPVVLTWTDDLGAVQTETVQVEVT